MCLGQDPASDDFARWLLEIGAGRGTNEDGTVTLPAHMRCPNNDLQSLINALYSRILLPDRPPLNDSYFLDRTILSAKNTDVDEINATILESFPGEKAVFTSADSVTEREYDYIPPEFLHTLAPSGFPLHTLEVKAGVPLMLLRNLNPLQGLYNGTRMILLSWTTRVLRCRVLRDGDDEDQQVDENTVLIPRITMESSSEENPIPLKRRQFPVRLAFAMTINKAQGQSVKWVGLNLRTPVFSHGQLYVALSRCTHPDRVFAIFPEHEEGSNTTNVVYTEVLRGLTDRINQ
jgi:ATP-dependent exoDNAse (exonuclease V) alpha subunit